MEREIINFGAPVLKLNFKKYLTESGCIHRGSHIHNEIEIVSVKKDSIFCNFENTRIKLCKGDILFINRRVIHKLTAESASAEFCYLQIDIDSYIRHLNPYFEKYPFIFMLGSSKPYEVYDSSSLLKQIFDSIESELEQKQNYYEEHLKADIYRIAAFMLRNKFLSKNIFIGSTKNIEKILPSIEYIEKNYRLDMSLEEISLISNLDKYYFCKLFKNTIGITYIEYLNSIRLNRAEEMLINSDMSIAEIASACGFNSIQYFNRLFKKDKKCTPRQFKNMINKEANGV